MGGPARRARSPPLDAFVVTPNGHGNTMYRDLGEDDLMRVLDWVMARYPIDASRVTITGPSMGGIGSARGRVPSPRSLRRRRAALRLPQLLRPPRHRGQPDASVGARASPKSDRTSFWADNGYATPLFIVHGTLRSAARNSGVLIDEYEKTALRDRCTSTPCSGTTSGRRHTRTSKGVEMAPRHSGAMRHPRQVNISHRCASATAKTRGCASSSSPRRTHGARCTRRSRRADRDRRVATRASRRSASIATQAARRDRADHRDDRRRSAVDFGATRRARDAQGREAVGARARRRTIGRVEARRDHGPDSATRSARRSSFVYGASDPAQTRANEEVARAWAAIRWGMTVRYPMMSDVEFFARGENARERSRALPRRQRAVEPGLARARGGAADPRRGRRGRRGTSASRANKLGAAFIRPNPRRTDRYVVVVEGVERARHVALAVAPRSASGLRRLRRNVAPARGQMLLGAGALRAGGFFKNDWSLPTSIEDPLAQAQRPAPKTEYDATPYLP